MTDEASISVHPGGYEPRCKACNFPGHEEHDKALLSGKLSDSDYAQMVGCSHKSIARHRPHIVKEIAQSAKAQAVLTADELFQSVQDEAAVVRELREAARTQGDIELALKAVDRALKCIELYAKVQGLIKDQPTINILVNPQWVELRTLIIQSLEPFPEAKEAVVHAIRGG